MTWRIDEGDVRTRLAELNTGSIQTCITSPPYWGLRDYGTAMWDGGDSECDHSPTSAPRESRPASGLTGGKSTVDAGTIQRGDCRCGATRIDSQLGLEPTPEQYVANMVEVFREVRRVLRDDGTLWLNLGDSYAANGRYDDKYEAERPDRGAISALDHAKHGGTGRKGYRGNGIKAKDLVGIPWMVAFALRADGWYLRSDIIWAKPNPMPESVTDRPTKSHEYLFLLTKSPRYFFDSDAIREKALQPLGEPALTGTQAAAHGGDQRNINGGGLTHSTLGTNQGAAGRNKRSVWTVTTQPFPGAHFATFPPKLIEPCILAGSPPKCCGECGAPWERVIEKGPAYPGAGWKDEGRQAANTVNNDGNRRSNMNGPLHAEWKRANPDRDLGWRSTCDHDDGTARATVLDPFAGAGTTLLVAEQQGRDSIGIELNPEYAELARDRIRRWESNPNGHLEAVEQLDGQMGLL